MLKKLWLFALSSLLVLPVFVSADTPVADADMMFYDYDWMYTPDEVTFKSDYYLYVVDFNCPSDVWYECSLRFYQWSTRKCTIASNAWSSEITLNTCNYLPAWTYDIKWDWYSSIHIRWYLNELPVTPSDPETPENDSVLWTFWSTLQWLVGNFVSSFSGILPTLIIIGLGVLALFVFLWAVKNYVKWIVLNRNRSRYEKMRDELLQDIDINYENRYINEQYYFLKQKWFSDDTLNKVFMSWDYKSTAWVDYTVEWWYDWRSRRAFRKYKDWHIENLTTEYL